MTSVPPVVSGFTSRVQRIKEQILAATPGICLERARIYSKVYREHEASPVIIRRALAFREAMRTMTIWIGDDDLLIGSHSSRLRAAPIFPEYAVEWILRELDDFEKRPGDAFFPGEEQKAELRELLPWWRGKTLIEKGYAIMAPELKAIHEAGIIRAEGNLTSGDGHVAIYHEKFLSRGIGGYVREVEERMAALDMTKADDAKKRIFHDAVRISLEGMQIYIARCAAFAREQAAAARAPERKAELERIAAACKHIESGPPRDFFEALQLVWFSQALLQIESNGHSLSLGRVDQYLHPYYEKDRAAGRLSDEQAMELLECLWLKLASVNKIRSWSHTRFSAGGPLYQNVTIGGQTPDGRDATNPLSYLILRSVGETRLTDRKSTRLNSSH